MIPIYWDKNFERELLMLNYLDSRNLSKIWWLSAVTIIIGALLGTDSTLPGVLPYFAFIFFGGISPVSYTHLTLPTN